MNAVKWFTRNHVAGNFMMLVVLLAGFTTWFKLKKEIFPEIAIDAVSVSIPYPNATPEESERGVVIPVEEAIADLQGIKKIRGTASQNIGSVLVEVETGYNVRDVMSDVKSRVDAIENFPEEAETPVLQEILIKAPVMSVTLTADTDETTMRKLAERVRDDLLTYEAPPAAGLGTFFARIFGGVPKISQVEIAGTRPYEISIEVSEDKLRELGLKLSDIAQAVRGTTLDLPGGSVRTERGEVILRALGKRYEAQEMASVPVKTNPDGSVVLLGDVAELIDGFEDVDISSRFDGKDAVVINVYRVGNEDTLALSELVRKYVADSNNTFPEGVKLAIWNDQSVYLLGRLDLLKRNAITGLLLVLLVLTLFLRPSLALLVAVGIPVSFAGGIWMMPYFGISINMISLFAFILVLGIVVDDAIVTGENVYHRIQKGEHPSVAAWKGTSEVGTIVVFGVLTTMVAFTPMLGLSGVSGKIWPNIPLVVIPTLMFSLLQSKFVLPAHLALLAPTNREKKINALLRFQRRIADGLERFVEKVYQPALGSALKWRYITVAAFASLLILSLAVVGTGFIQFRFFPDVEGDILSAKVELAQGVPFVETQKVVERMEAAARELSAKYETRSGKPIIKHMLSSSGTQPFITGVPSGGPPKQTHLGEVTIELAPADERTITSEELVTEWRRLVGTLPGVVELSIQAETANSGNAIDVTLTGPDLGRLEAATVFAKKGLEDYAGVIDISDSNRAGKDELRFGELTAAGRAMGFRLEDVASQVRDAFYGNEVQRLQRGRDEVKVMVRFPKDARRTLESLETMKIRTPQGDEVPLLQIISLEPGRGPAVIERTDRQRSIKVQADVETGVNANEVVSGFTEKTLEEIPQRFPGVRYSFEGEQKDQADSVREIGIGFLASLVGMYVLIAIPLRSYLQPLIIMSVIPFGLVGAIWGHALLGMDLSIMSMCGLVALAGVVVNDSLVMVDYVNRHRDESATLRDAAIAAGGRRFRAIMLTSLTTFVGIMPMILETDVQAKFLVPMAVSLAFGILFATVITLFLVPGIYLILEDLKNLGGRLGKNKP
ncbi:MAG: efflux RND transporter permease subunit [Akkermansiaceae bacterium]|jgi:multidrug efflux pump subunit AcrB|nr:efflux RND transporter permease subunit [Akkermansiaceae bacterium]MDP4646142.1 efflux RND transporter permease subunit [Akkermansiaceae bacterium]MDP4720941.1 efflux RND transporter permease subunit [Akkermansiaceae bacterium]MDP4780700.1 efflux RND transporter permease subunit [Akkermansiaceae bacterium]MDP4845646.1 efflux RND transporter permease subunit [Akkermansiaceae bacterium]